MISRTFMGVLTLAALSGAQALADEARCHDRAQIDAIGADLVRRIDQTAPSRLHTAHLDRPLRLNCAGREGHECSLRSDGSGNLAIGEESSASRLPSDGARLLLWVNRFMSAARDGQYYAPALAQVIHNSSAALPASAQTLLACYATAQTSCRGDDDSHCSYDGAAARSAMERLTASTSIRASDSGVDYSNIASNFDAAGHIGRMPNPVEAREGASAADSDRSYLNNLGLRGFTVMVRGPTGSSSATSESVDADDPSVRVQ